MQNLEKFSKELELLCRKFNVKLEERVDYELDEETNEYTYVEKFMTVLDIDNSISVPLASLID